MFEKIDIFGKPVLFRFNGKEKSKSSIGGWFSLFLLAFVLWVIYNVGKDIIYRINPKIIMSEAYSEDPKPMVLSDETFSFAAGLQVPITYAHYINESIYTLEAHFTRQIREIDENGTLRIKAEYPSLALERCKKEHFGVHGPKFENLELNDMYCLKKEQPGFDKLVLQGTFESPIFQDIEIVVKPCDPETSNVTCAPKETIDEMLGSCYFAIYYTNLAIDAKNATDPSFTFRDSYYTTVSNSFFKDIPIWLAHVQLKSDFGWLVASEEVQNFVKVGSVGESVSFLQKNQKRMLNLRIRMGKITTSYERSYLKIGEIVASANGFATAGLIAIFIFLGPFSKVKFYERLINELFDLKMLQNDINARRNSKRNQNRKSINAKPIKHNNEDTHSKLDREEMKLTTLNNRLNQGMDSLPPIDLESFSKLPFSDEEKDIEKPAANVYIKAPSPSKTDHDIKLSQCPIDHNTIDLKSFEIIENKESPLKAGHLKKIHLSSVSEEQSIHSPEKCLTNSSFPSMHHSPQSHKTKLPEPLFRHVKPDKIPIQPKVKILENYEPSCPEEELAMLESLMVDEKELKRIKSREFHREPSISKSIGKVEKLKRTISSLHITKKGSGQKALQLSDKFDRKTDEEEVDQKAEELSTLLNKDADKISISFLEYLCSYFWRSKSLKEKLKLLDAGIRRIEERLDIFNVLKKFREIDKLKLLLLENEQLVLFDTLPKPELSSKSCDDNLEHSKSFVQFRESRFISERRKKDLILRAYKNLKKKTDKAMIDRKLLDIYDDIIGF